MSDTARLVDPPPLSRTNWQSDALDSFSIAIFLSVHLLKPVLSIVSHQLSFFLCFRNITIGPIQVFLHQQRTLFSHCRSFRISNFLSITLFPLRIDLSADSQVQVFQLLFFCCKFRIRWFIRTGFSWERQGQMRDTYRKCGEGSWIGGAACVSTLSRLGW